MENFGKLYIVATPIGNLEDITLRAIRILGEVDVIFAEDTRTTKILLNKHNIEYKKIDSYNAENHINKNSIVLKTLKEGKNVALVSDAGTPSISDPGFSLVSYIRKESDNNVKILSIPGASALTSFISILGVGTHAFTFYGFLPHKKGRQTMLKEMLNSKYSSVFYESTHRIEKCLEEVSVLNSENRKIAIGKELTKVFEDVIIGSSQEILEFFKKDPQKTKGEFVLMII